MVHLESEMPLRFDIPDITIEDAANIIANTSDEELAKLYMAAWKFWRVVRATDDHLAWLEPAAAIGNALDIAYEAPLLAAGSSISE